MELVIVSIGECFNTVNRGWGGWINKAERRDRGAETANQESSSVARRDWLNAFGERVAPGGQTGNNPAVLSLAGRRGGVNNGTARGGW